MDLMDLSHQILLNLLGALNFKIGLSMSFCSRSMSFCSRLRKPLFVSFEIAKIRWSFFSQMVNARASFEITLFLWSFYAIDRGIFCRFVRGYKFLLVLFALDGKIRRSYCSRSRNPAGPHALRSSWSSFRRSSISNNSFLSR
jgi:hypothetical protein